MRGSFPDEISVRHNLETAPTAPRALEMFAGTRRHPSIIFTLLGKLPAGLLTKQHKISAKKNQNKS